MTYSLPVASRLAPSALVTLIQVEADGLRDAKRRAKGKARVKFGFFKPIVIDGHAAAVQLWLAARAEHRMQTAGLNGISEPFWKRNEPEEFESFEFD